MKTTTRSLKPAPNGNNPRQSREQTQNDGEEWFKYAACCPPCQTRVLGGRGGCRRASSAQFTAPRAAGASAFERGSSTGTRQHSSRGKRQLGRHSADTRVRVRARKRGRAGFDLATLRSAAASPPSVLYGRAGRSPRLDVRVRRRHPKRSAEVRQKRPRQRPRWAQPVPRR